jgi:hypothetical protein
LADGSDPGTDAPDEDVVSDRDGLTSLMTDAHCHLAIGTPSFYLGLNAPYIHYTPPPLTDEIGGCSNRFLPFSRHIIYLEDL